MVCGGRRDQHHPMPFPEYCYCCLTLKCPLLPLAPQETTARVTQTGFLTNPVPPAPAVGTSDSCGEPSPSQDRGVLSNPCWLPPRPTPSPAGAPHVRVALKALLHKVVEVGREGAVVGVGGRVTVGGPGGAGGQALAQARVGCRARGAHGQLLGGDGAGIQQAGHCAVQLLQQHLGRTEPGPGWRGPRKDPSSFTSPLFSKHTSDSGAAKTEVGQGLSLSYFDFLHSVPRQTSTSSCPVHQSSSICEAHFSETCI